MADEEIQNDTIEEVVDPGEVQETEETKSSEQQAETQETRESKIPNIDKQGLSTKVETGESILDWVQGAWKSATGRGKEKTESTVEQIEETPTRSKDQAVPSTFLEAAKADGWDDKDVQEFAANKTDEELLELIPHLVEAADEEEEETEPEEPEKETGKTDEKDVDLEAFKSSLREEIRNEIFQEYGSKLDVLDDFRAEQTSRQNIQVFETANDLMDGASKDLPVFGTFEEIPRFTTGPREGEPVPTSPAFKARAEVFQMAADLMAAGRYTSMKDATVNALAWYRGQHGQKEMERKVVRNLKNQEKKLSGSRTGKETKREFTNTREEILDYIEQAKKVAGAS